MLNNNFDCPLCKKTIRDDYNKLYSMKYDHDGQSSQQYLWLYATNYGDNWWGYDKKSNCKLERIYNDHLTRLNIRENQNNNANINLSITNIKKPPNVITNNIIPNDFVSLTLDIIDTTIQDTDDDINFSDNDATRDKNITIDDNENDISYILKIGLYEYRIDFDIMKQISISDSAKSRKIKRIDNISNEINYLKSQNIIGIAGIKFE